MVVMHETAIINMQYFQYYISVFIKS